MAKKVIGIVPSASLFQQEDPYLDQYRFVNHYGKRIVENGGIPVGILPVDGHAELSALELCQGFIICGGGRIFPYHFEITEYAVQRGIPILGICLGMQTIGSWFRVKEEAEKRRYEGSLLSLYEQMKKEKFMFTLPVEHHWDVQPKRDDLEKAKHPVYVKKGTHLHQILNADVIQGVTLHHYQLNGAAKELTVSAGTEDGTIEGIEYGSRVLGVQFHPEADRSLEKLFVDFFQLKNGIQDIQEREYN